MAISKTMIGVDINGKPTYSIYFTTLNFQVNLAANTPATFTVPAEYENWEVYFAITPGSVIWVANNDTAEAPATSAFVATTSQMNPQGRLVNGGDVISVLTEQTSCNVGVSLYATS